MTKWEVSGIGGTWTLRLTPHLFVRVERYCDYTGKRRYSVKVFGIALGEVGTLDGAQKHGINTAKEWITEASKVLESEE